MKRTIYPLLLAFVCFSSSPGVADIRPMTLAPPHRPSVNMQSVSEITKQIESGTFAGKALTSLYAKRGLIKTVLGDKAGALEDYSSAIKILPSAPLYILRIGLYIQLSNPKAALSDCDALAQLDPKSPLGHRMRAAVFEKLGDASGYATETDEAIALAQDPFQILSDRAEHYFRIGDFEHAISDYNAAIKLRPNSPDLISNRGDSEMQMGDYTSALSDYDQAIALNPDHLIANVADRNRVLPLYGLGRDLEAAAAAAKAADDDPSDAYRVLWLNLMRLTIGKSDQEDFKKRVNTLDRSKWPWPIISFWLGETDEKAVFQAALMGSPEDKKGQMCEAQFYIGESERLRNDLEIARSMFEQAIKICPPGFSEIDGARIELSRLGGKKTSLQKSGISK